MTDKHNLLVNAAAPPGDSPGAGWRFVAASEGGARGEARDSDEGPSLVIAHSTYAEGSRWEQTIAGLTPGLLLTLSGAAHTQGPCWRRFGTDQWIAGGAQIALEAFARGESDAPQSLGAAEHAFFPPTDPDGVLTQDAQMTGAVRLVVPDGADVIVASARLSAEGAVTFSCLTLTAREADAGRMNDELVDAMVAAGSIHSPAIADAFRRVPRHPFLPHVDLARAYEDDAVVTHSLETGLAISSSSQPTMMALMLEQLQVEAGMRVLEIGSGTGYNAALLAQLAGPGNVWTVDVDEEFCAEARAHLEAARVTGVHVVCADGWDGWPPAAPYDRIIVTASAHDIAPAWADQLRPGGGRLVLPWGEPQRPQRSLAFRKEGSRLVMESALFCGFMEMRGRDAGTPPANAGLGAHWQDWLFPGQPPGDPTRLTAYPRGTAPSPGDGEYLIRRRWFDYIASWS